MILIEFFKIGLNDLKNFRKFIKLHIKKKILQKLYWITIAKW